MEKLLLRVTEAAQVLGMGRSKVYEMAKAGEIPAIYIGRAVRVPADALRQWVEQQNKDQAAPW